MYGVTESHLKRIENLLVDGMSPKDVSEKHRSVNAIHDAIFVNVKNHIFVFPVLLSHYKESNFYYLNARLSVKKKKKDGNCVIKNNPTKKLCIGFISKF